MFGHQSPLDLLATVALLSPQQAIVQQGANPKKICAVSLPHDGGSSAKCKITVKVNHCCSKQPSEDFYFSTVTRGTQKSVRENADCETTLHKAGSDTKVIVFRAPCLSVSDGKNKKRFSPVIYTGMKEPHLVEVSASCPCCVPSFELVTPPNLKVFEVAGDEPTQQQKAEMNAFRSSSTPAPRNKRLLKKESEDSPKRLKIAPFHKELQEAAESDDATESDDEATESDDKATKLDDEAAKSLLD